MATFSGSKLDDAEKTPTPAKVAERHPDDTSDDISLDHEVYDSSSVDPVLAKKMALISSAIGEIGMTPWQWKLFFFNRFGYAVDSPAVDREFGRPNKRFAGVALASQIGLLAGAALWGFSADIIGRKLAFNSSLFICAGFVLIAGGMPNYVSFAAMVSIYSAGVGGNYVLDATNLLEFLPVTHTWLVTFMSIWWAVGYTITGLVAWGFMSNLSCPTKSTPATCHRDQNWGWRYLHFTAGSIVLALSVVRLLFIRMQQTPRWLIAQNRDVEAYTVLENLAKRYNRPFTLKLEDFESKGCVLHTEKSRWSAFRLTKHFGGLFETRMLTYSTLVIIANWFIIGMVTPLYSVFLPYYLASRGATIAGLFGPIVAGILVETKLFGRRGTLAIGTLPTMILNLATSTQIQTPAQNVGVSAAITAASNIYYGTIYAYTPEILPSAHRATGYGMCVVLNRVGGITGVLIGSYANVETTAPLFVCASLFGLLVLLSLLLPFETRGKRSN
ncbi:putative sugar transporter [Setomelanomma holmii]|uniref:Sugar transporter n=1 Tax=Setomelanomma holmii TaxID=210430 RepID=A0A9P4LQN6_9PLEO|nr:putative sugar transporter [Setomelanomma holmii]